MLVTNKIKIDIARQGAPPRLDAMQNDANARAVEISLLENGSAWTVPDGVSAAVSYEKPDGTSGLYDRLPNVLSAVQTSGNTIRFTMAPQMLTVPGLVRVAVVLIKDTEQISTFPLDIYVTAQPGAGAEKSGNYYYYTTFEALNNAIGLLKELQTTDKSSLVAAVNEVFRKIGTGTGSGGGGYSPTVELEETADGVWLRITDINGTQEAFIPKGQPGIPGADGISPTVAVSKSGKVTTVSITDKDGTKTATINDGADGYTPVKGKDYFDGDPGAPGTSVTVSKVTESSEDGGSNVVEFSDGKTLTVKNGRTPVKGTDYWTNADKQEILNELKAEQTGMLEIPLTEVGYMEGGNGWNQLNTTQATARNSGYVEIPEGYTHIKATLAINKYGWAVLFATGNGTGLILDSTVSVLGGETPALAEYFVEIPTNAKYVMVSTFTLPDSCSAYFANEEQTEEAPAGIFDGTEFALFKQWGIVGDSLSVGHTSDSDGNASSPNLDYSWGQYLARRIGNTCLNFGRSGVSAKAWMTDAKGYNLLIQPEQLCQCYILALGANDADYTLGSIADVDFSNMNNNADTEYGWYAKVINAIRTTAPQAPIFLFTLPYPRNTDVKIQAINGMIREFASNENFSMVYLVDLDADYNDYFKEGKLGNCIGNTGWHLTALGYLYASVVNEIAISKVMAEHPGDFQNVFEIPYGTAETDTPTTETWVFTLEDGSTVSKDVVIG